MRDTLNELMNREDPKETNEVTPAELMATITMQHNHYFPDRWMHAKVVTDLKPAKPPLIATSYHPISLLSTRYKLLERVVNIRVVAHISSQYILHDEQFGSGVGTR
ncbi:hypothetical protein PR048_028417 [Dryococelus australis]|uniref:Uncharacterized protein n=1 Tax=Dryococelus australis TaxID=614101 RepID=A0ABQ9GD55_9NEOP|nr:hypothetical protein PR048_028417 [Dryococelus australis]